MNGRYEYRCVGCEWDAEALQELIESCRKQIGLEEIRFYGFLSFEPMPLVAFSNYHEHEGLHDLAPHFGFGEKSVGRLLFRWGHKMNLHPTLSSYEFLSEDFIGPLGGWVVYSFYDSTNPEQSLILARAVAILGELEYD